MKRRRSATAGTSRTAKKRILVVDHDVFLRRAMSQFLAHKGYRVLTAGTGSEALKIAGTQRIDLVLLDLNLPNDSGWTVFEHLTRRQPLLSVAVISARSGQLFTALGAGASALLELPFGLPRLARAVRRLMAEPPRNRLARLAGRVADFYYYSASPGQSSMR